MSAERRATRVTVGAGVVNYNGGERIVRVIEALQRQTYPLEQIVVVDNHSSDGSPAQIRERFPAVEIITLSDNLGLTVARNIGLRTIQATLVFLVDHDIYPEPTAIEKMVEAYEKQKSTVVCPRIRLIPERNIVQMEGAALHFLGLLVLRHGHQPVESLSTNAGYVEACTGGCLLLHRQSVLDIGGFDELYFFYFEDLEFSLRVRASGHRIWCEPRAEVFHEPAEGTPSLSYRGSGAYPRQRALLTMRNRILTILIHYRFRTILLLMPAFMLFELATLAMAARRGWTKAWFEAWSWQFRNAAKIGQRRRCLTRIRRLEDRALLVGGPPPLAPGLLSSRLEQRLFKLFSMALNAYWAFARPWIA